MHLQGQTWSKSPRHAPKLSRYFCSSTQSCAEHCCRERWKASARMETFCKYAHPVLLGIPTTFSTYRPCAAWSCLKQSNKLFLLLLCPLSVLHLLPGNNLLPWRGVLGFGTVLFGKFLFALSVIFILHTWSFQCLTTLERRNPFQWERKARQFVLALSACLSLSQIMSLGTWAEMQTAKMQALSGTICTLITAGSLSIGTLGQY